jgi:hypothetical protein
MCTCVFLLHQESFNMILMTNPSYQMGVSHAGIVKRRNKNELTRHTTPRMTRPLHRRI